MALGRGKHDRIGRVLVLGLGKSGKSVARYCAELLGSRVSGLFIAAGARNDDSARFVEELAREGIDYAFGDDALAAFAGSEPQFDLCVASPGIPYWSELYQAGLSASKRLMSEVEFAWLESSPESTWVAITGTNGKTTTTACCAHVLRAAGLAADAVGNIGDVCLDAVAAGQTDVFVAEVSSYQLYSTSEFAPDVAVVLNVTPDHLHWHKTFEAYRDAKFHLLDTMRAAGAAQTGSRRKVAVLDASDDVVRAKVREAKALDDAERGFDYIAMGTAEGIGGDMRARCGAENAAFLADDGVLTVAFCGVEHALLHASELLLKGAHNVSNALAAAAVAVALGADDAGIVRGLSTFAPLEHRIEPCGNVAGIECYNDSKATNVDATLKALEAFPGKRLHVLLGGDDKGTDLAALCSSVVEHAAGAVCFGAAGPRFADALEQELAGKGGLELDRAATMADALECALGKASAGDVVLLSPACASFDEFSSFEHRGRVFKQLVAERAARLGDDATQGGHA